MKSRCFSSKWLALGLLALAINTGFGALVFDQDFTTGFANNGDVPDGNPSGWQNSQVLSGLSAASDTMDVRVTLTISGGWNGDLHAWLRHETTGGTGFSVLLNRPGTPGNGGLGYGNSGFEMVFSDLGAADLHNYQNHSPVFNGSQLQGTWQPEGAAFSSSFNNLDANGTWTLFVSDMSPGFQSHIESWGLEIEAVPEPVNTALMVFAGMFALATAWRLRRARRIAE